MEVEDPEQGEGQGDDGEASKSSVSPNAGNAADAPNALQGLAPGAWKRIGIVLLAVILVSGAVRLAQALWPGPPEAKSSDYGMTAIVCSRNRKSLTAHGSLVNTSKTRRAFKVRVRFSEANGDEVDDGTATTRPIDPGDSAIYFVGIPHADAPADTTCGVANVYEVGG